MDGLRAGIFVLDTSGNIIYSNRAANEIVEAADCLRGAGGKLSARQPEANQLLQEAFRT
jgi:nitrogen fixation/metabolism regulation signal transduction histidine kinase